MWNKQAGTASFHGVDLSGMRELAETLLAGTAPIRVWTLSGELGAGKTTLIKIFCTLLGVKEVVSSPSFVILNEYDTSDHGKVYHFDFFRIKNGAEAENMGVSEYLDSGNFCFIEWPEKLGRDVPAPKVNLHIDIDQNNLRTISVSIHV